MLGLPRRPVRRAARLAAFPTEGLPVERPVTIRWNEQLVPYVEAETDRDLAVALGAVHAHLREGQMDFLRLLAQGRLSEVLGPFAREVDHALRIVDFGRAVPEMERRLPPETRAWIEGYCAGLNHHRSRARRRPPELRLLGRRGREPWTVRDVLTVGRLAGADFGWLTYFWLLKRRARPGFAELWRRVREVGEAMADPFGEGAGPAAFARMLTGANRAGSNSVAVAAHRSASGGAMIASDPHLGLSLPNLWLLVGFSSPSYKAVGATLPGVPIMGFGRNADLAWGGTNLRAASTDLYDVSYLPPESFETRKVRIRTRFAGTAEREVRCTPFGPVLSDAKLFPGKPGETVAFRWVGHEPTDEITAFLRATKARDPEELREAFQGYGLTPLNVIFADRQGNIGHLLAVNQPVRQRFAEDDLVLDARDPETHWQGFVGVADLPFTVNPPEGVIASANNRPRGTNIPIGFLFGVETRLRRLYELLNRREQLSFEDLAELQTDTGMPEAAALARGLAERIAASGATAEEPAAELARRLRAWDGDYGEASRGAVAFEMLLYHLVPAVEGEGRPAAYGEQQSQWSHILSYLLRDLAALPAERRNGVLREAAARAAAGMDRFETWGDMHRLKVAHFLAEVPVIGDAFVLGDEPAAGSRATPMKSAHGLVNDRHTATMGSMARHISDLSDPDANWFVLLGGQDGWFGSESFADQVPMWRERRYIRMPLTPERVAAEFPTAVRIEPVH